tara:strand:- start:7977 stop:8123 length:147 start_codon:yes stop_codon:yes gene_type:complete
VKNNKEVKKRIGALKVSEGDTAGVGRSENDADATVGDLIMREVVSTET